MFVCVCMFGREREGEIVSRERESEREGEEIERERER